ncbi:hypothetical protein NEMIN01_0344 [Nematocida minor]|uniref:uncharacterized protein n=1 Tax=Nematocida minor TaxID=1912983 RepID=UPI0022205E2B|nr:uncharacterized protein NEMIN01_0344 [Nematocida minor]KAI5189178.1 hypothetical protein NEMIN01_0344 [Nematocida minor]
MRLNPFQAKTAPSSSIHAALSSVFNTAEPERPAKKEKIEEVTEETAEIDEKNILSALATHKKEEIKEPWLSPSSICNFLRASVDEITKNSLEEKLGSLLYYQTPETHKIKKDSSDAYSAIFNNWRKGLSGLFAEYRKANAKKSDFSFYAYSDKTVYHFHTNGYNGCVHPCCEDAVIYSLHVLPTDKSLNDLFDSKFKKDKQGCYLSGRSVLFILDTIINTEASTVCALPLILSKHPFINSILTKPAVVIKSEKRSNNSMYRVSMKGWALTEDILMLNAAMHLEAKQTDDIQ